MIIPSKRIFSSQRCCCYYTNNYKQLLTAKCIIDRYSQLRPSNSTNPDPPQTTSYAHSAPLIYKHIQENPKINASLAIIKKAISQNLKLSWLPPKVSWGPATMKSTMLLKTSKPPIWGKPNVFCRTCCRKIETSCAKTQRTTKKSYQFWL